MVARHELVQIRRVRAVRPAVAVEPGIPKPLVISEDREDVGAGESRGGGQPGGQPGGGGRSKNTRHR